MKKILVSDKGDLVLADAPRPELHDDEVEIKVVAVGVNFADVKIRFGYYSDKSRRNPEMGSEVAGFVSRAGRDAHRFAVGEKVFAVSHWGGGYAEYMVAPEHSVFRLPVHLSFEEGAAFAVTAQTAYHLVHSVAKVERGETVLVHAAAGGVGTMLTQLCALQGATVIALSSADWKLEKLKPLGATLAMKYDDDVVGQTMRLTRDEGVNAIFDGNGGAFFPNNFKMLALRGRVALFGNSAGDIPPINPYQLVYSSHQLLGFSMRAIAATPERYLDAYRWIFARLRSGELKIEIGHRFKLEEADKAHRLLMSRGNYGKIVLLA
ncbi:MAG: zinc-binding dehydrogenase [Chloroherpetonaceae bacterium]|nr:zinc-binding dehydrogenase [Chloroherpetonaceae bacterium]MDW8436611.1 zinc-binding dehydrogenase [Chloroherpetonaceae bacterium]